MGGVKVLRGSTKPWNAGDRGIFIGVNQIYIYIYTYGVYIYIHTHIWYICISKWIATYLQ